MIVVFLFFYIFVAVFEAVYYVRKIIFDFYLCDEYV